MENDFKLFKTQLKEKNKSKIMKLKEKINQY